MRGNGSVTEGGQPGNLGNSGTPSGLLDSGRLVNMEDRYHCVRASPGDLLSQRDVLSISRYLGNHVRLVIKGLGSNIISSVGHSVALNKVNEADYIAGLEAASIVSMVQGHVSSEQLELALSGGSTVGTDVKYPSARAVTQQPEVSKLLLNRSRTGRPVNAAGALSGVAVFVSVPQLVVAPGDGATVGGKGELLVLNPTALNGSLDIDRPLVVELVNVAFSLDNSQLVNISDNGAALEVNRVDIGVVRFAVASPGDNNVSGGNLGQVVQGSLHFCGSRSVAEACGGAVDGGVVEVELVLEVSGVVDEHLIHGRILLVDDQSLHLDPSPVDSVGVSSNVDLVSGEKSLVKNTGGLDKR
mmetsp:Transcript_14282/g.26217  ORF Transcript_14282/g.26217 Transcript_14282/m.26217 type:complete len:357 (+) Transcript_14282:10099-11169(+)